MGLYMIRGGRLEDAAALAELVNYAGEGMPLRLWEDMREPGETAWDVGRRRAAREEGAFSYRNAVILDVDDAAVGALIGYPQPASPEPIDPAAMPPVFVPLQELENLAPGTWYVNVLAVLPEFRCRGIGRRLLGAADDIAAGLGLPGLSVIVSDANAGARRLYEACGYREAARRAKVKEGPGAEDEGEAWMLMTKTL